VFDINGGEFLVLIVVALVILGPERLPQYAQQLARLVREARTFANKAREQVRNEMGEEFDDVDWTALDPRRYDPRRIVREALLDGDDDPLGLSSWSSNGTTNGTVNGTTSDSGPNVPENMRADAGGGDGEPSRAPRTGTPQPYDTDAT
jgi:sec-independent protein translocase protein TatB